MIVHCIVSQQRISEEERQLVLRMMTAIDIIKWDLTNIAIYPVPKDVDLSDATKIYVAFGKQAAFALSLNNCEAIEFPELSKLANTPANGTCRDLAFQKLLNLQQHISTMSLAFTNDDMPQLSSTELLKLTKIKNNKTGVTFICKNGTTLRVSFVASDDVPADKHITFEELLAIKLGMEIFNG